MLVCECGSDECTPGEEKKGFLVYQRAQRRKYGRSRSSAVLFQPVPHRGHTHMHTHMPGARSPAEWHWSLFMVSVRGLPYRTTHTHVLIVTHMGRPSKTLKGLVFIFAGLLIRRVQGAAMRGNAPLAMGGTGLSVGGGACPTVLDPSSTRCFSSFGLQISFQRGPPSSNPTKQIEFQSRSFFLSEVYLWSAQSRMLELQPLQVAPGRSKGL